MIINCKLQIFVNDNFIFLDDLADWNADTIDQICDPIFKLFQQVFESNRSEILRFGWRCHTHGDAHTVAVLIIKKIDVDDLLINQKLSVDEALENLSLQSAKLFWDQMYASSLELMAQKWRTTCLEYLARNSPNSLNYLQN